MNKSNFSEGIKMLEEYYNVKLTNANINIYWSRLRGYDDKTFKGIIIRCIDTLKFFPKIADIKEITEGNLEDEAEIAWLILKEKIESHDGYVSVSFLENPVIGSVVEALGGWIRICDTTIEEEKWVKKEFIKLYPIMKRRDNHPEKLTGIIELENNQKGYSEGYMLERYGRLLDGTKVERKKLKGEMNE
ncbi:hypothetical protein ES708_31177 [subsurface metagenome]